MVAIRRGRGAGSSDRSVPAQSRRTPERTYKRGFVCRVYGRSAFKGAGEWSSNAVGVCNAVRELYRDFKAQTLGHPGEVPIVAITGMDSFKGRYGTNYSPQLTITAWIKRPAELPDEPVVPVKGNGAASPLASQIDPGQHDGLDDDIPF
jgi:hypothetical protein